VAALASVPPFTVALAAALFLSACAANGTLRPATGQLAHCDRHLAACSTLIAYSRDLGAISPSRTVTFLVSLRDPLAARRAADVAAIYRPGPSFMRFESWHTLAGQGAPAALVHRAQRILKREGLSSAWHPGNTWMSVAGPAGALDRVFGVHVHSYLSPVGIAYYDSATTVTVPPNLRREIAGITSMSSYPFVRRAAIPSGGLKPADLLSAYGMNPPSSIRLDGSGQTIAVVEVDGFAQSDLDTFTARFHLPPLRPRIEFGSALKAGIETEMDVEVIHSIAPKAAITVYNCSNPCTWVSLLGAIAAAIRNTPRGIISMSLAGCEPSDSAALVKSIDSTENVAAAMGTSVYVSSGDNGAYQCLTNDFHSPPIPKYISVSDLSTAPDVTGVGGTRVSVNRDGTRYREDVWENTAATSGPGGGVSVFVPLPAY
jgi:kumamolisin